MSDFACPNCGNTLFAAWYYTAETQECELELDEDGNLIPDYTGTMIGDAEAGEDECYVCTACDWRVIVGNWKYTPYKKPRYLKPN